MGIFCTRNHAVKIEWGHLRWQYANCFHLISGFGIAGMPGWPQMPNLSTLGSDPEIFSLSDMGSATSNYTTNRRNAVHRMKVADYRKLHIFDISRFSRFPAISM